MTPTGFQPLGAGQHHSNRTDEDDGGAEVIRHPEQLPDEPRPVAKVLLDELAADDAQEGGAGLVGDRLGQQRLPGARFAVKDHPLEEMRIVRVR